MKTLLRFATITVASTALIAGGATAATANTTSSTATAPASSSPATSSWSARVTPQAIGDAAITSIKIKDGYLHRKGVNFFPGTLVAAGGNIKNVTANVVDSSNRVKGTAALYLNGAELPNTVGAGKLRLTGVVIHYFDGTSEASPTVSNFFYARRVITSKHTYPLHITARGKSHTVKVKGVKIFVPSTGQYKTLKSIKLQYKKGSKWKTKKTIKLNSAGNGKYKFKTGKKYRYRIYSGKTSTSSGFQTRQSKKI
ncbi:hypothetical protein [Aeromicrobium sp. P5_D10]